jgi:hypothetical protein
MSCNSRIEYTWQLFLKFIGFRYGLGNSCSNECGKMGMCKTWEHKNTTKLKLSTKLSTKWCWLLNSNLTPSHQSNL